MTRLDQFFGSAAEDHPGLSGFSLLSQGREAFIVRLALADLAERNLDMQYFNWEGDTTGRIIVDRVIRAADRGVQVRLLVEIPSTNPVVPTSSEPPSTPTPTSRSACSIRTPTGDGQRSTSWSTSVG